MRATTGERYYISPSMIEPDTWVVRDGARINADGDVWVEVAGCSYAQAVALCAELNGGRLMTVREIAAAVNAMVL